VRPEILRGHFQHARFNEPIHARHTLLNGLNRIVIRVCPSGVKRCHVAIIRHAGDQGHHRCADEPGNSNDTGHSCRINAEKRDEHLILHPEVHVRKKIKGQAFSKMSNQFRKAFLSGNHDGLVKTRAAFLYPSIQHWV